MKRTLMGVLLGVLIAAGGLAAAFFTGWITTSRPMTEMAAMEMAEGEQMPADHDMSAMGAGAQEPMPADHDMSAMGTAGPAGGTEAAAAESGAPPANAVMISPDRQRLIGLRTARVERLSLDRTIRTVGVVEYDERLVRHIHTKVSGWIETLQVDFTGELVAEGQQLLEIYSPELVSTQEEFLLALRAQASLGNSSFAVVKESAESLLAATRRRLQLWDIPDAEIEALEKAGEPSKTLAVFSPIQGFVIHKMAYEGLHVTPNTELYTIADLRHVWITADIYEYELPLIKIGQSARVTLPYFPGETFEGVVDYIYPYMEGETRTVKARLVFSNPGWKLKPDMYADVVLSVQLGEGLLIPEDAVIDTGIRKVAFRALEGGHFQPVEIETGFKVGDMIQVLAGLQEGEEVVAGATFLVDSESKLGSALRSMGNMPGMSH